MKAGNARHQELHAERTGKTDLPWHQGRPHPSLGAPISHSLREAATLGGSDFFAFPDREQVLE